MNGLGVLIQLSTTVIKRRERRVTRNRNVELREESLGLGSDPLAKSSR
jgi:hypothetical protein